MKTTKPIFLNFSSRFHAVAILILIQLIFVLNLCARFRNPLILIRMFSNPFIEDHCWVVSFKCWSFLWTSHSITRLNCHSLIFALSWTGWVSVVIDFNMIGKWKTLKMISLSGRILSASLPSVSISVSAIVFVGSMIGPTERICVQTTENEYAVHNELY